MLNDNLTNTLEMFSEHRYAWKFRSWNINMCHTNAKYVFEKLTKFCWSRDLLKEAFLFTAILLSVLRVYRWETFYAKLLYPEGRIMQQPPHPWKIWKKKRVWKLKTDISDIEQFSNSKNKCWNKLPQNDQFLLLVYLQIMIHVRISPNPCCF